MAVEQQRPASPAGGTSARVLNAVLGVWLFISAFVWPHTMAQRTNTWILGVLALFFALMAASTPRVRYLNTILAIWLFISAWALPTISPGTIWNNVLVAIAIFVVSLVPSLSKTTSPGLMGHRSASPHA